MYFFSGFWARFIPVFALFLVPLVSLFVFFMVLRPPSPPLCLFYARVVFLAFFRTFLPRAVFFYVPILISVFVYIIVRWRARLQ